MKKTTKAFQLNPMQEPVTIKLNPKDKTWYPQTHFYADKNEIFIYGQGWVKTDKWKEQVIQPFQDPYTAQEVKTIADEYGFNAAMGMIGRGNNQSLFDDNGCGSDYTKYEVANMTTLGKVYDDYTTLVQSIGDAFIANLLKKEFTLHGKVEKGLLWHNYKSEDDPGNIVGSVGIYDKVHLHPLQHVEHCIGMSIFGCRCLPMFNPMTFDDMLMRLFFYKYYSENGRKSRKMLDKCVSVRDRIAHLTTETIATSFNKIFEVQDTFEA